MLDKSPKDVSNADNMLKYTPLHVVAEAVVTPAEKVGFAKIGNASLRERFKDDPKKDEYMAQYSASENESDYPDPGALAALLLKAGVDPNVKDGGNATALHRAVYKGKAGVVKALVDGKANLEIRHGLGGGGNGFPTALMLAAMKGDLAVVKLLVEGGADVNAKLVEYKADSASLKALGLDPKTTAWAKTTNTAKTLAASAGRTEVAQYLQGVSK